MIDIVSEGFSHEGSFRWKGTVGENCDCDSAITEAEMFDDGMNHFSIMCFDFNIILQRVTVKTLVRNKLILIFLVSRSMRTRCTDCHSSLANVSPAS